MTQSGFARHRRLRGTPGLRRLVSETRLSADDLVMPLFISDRKGESAEIGSMPGIKRWGVDRIAEALDPVVTSGIGAVLMFGVTDTKDGRGSQAFAEDGVAQRAIRATKAAYPDLVVISDVCLCEYTDHGHCGATEGATEDTEDTEGATEDTEGATEHTEGGESGRGLVPLNDETLPLLQRIAVTHVQAGADVMAPSGMMDGGVTAIRTALDGAGYLETPIMSYAVKYASAFYGPFREAAEGAPQFGDRRSHQMDPPNRREALREARADVEQGADILMVKPAATYLDVIADLRRETDVPVAAYHVSGEYAMIKAAVANGWLDERATVLETLTGIKRAGADIIVTYHAVEVAGWL